MIEDASHYDLVAIEHELKGREREREKEEEDMVRVKWEGTGGQMIPVHAVKG